MIASDLSRPAVISVSMKQHFEHSNVRFSVPFWRGSIVTSIMRVRHRAQLGRSIRASRTSVNENDGDMAQRVRI
jgi:hypothetical protein